VTRSSENHMLEGTKGEHPDDGRDTESQRSGHDEKSEKKFAILGGQKNSANMMWIAALRRGKRHGSEQAVRKRKTWGKEKNV